MWALIVTLVVVGLLLLGIELLIIPGFGVTGILGLASFAASCYIAFDSLVVAAGMAVAVAVVMIASLFVIFVLRSKTWKKITLQTNIDSKIDEVPQNKGIEVGMTGVALTRLAPAGQAGFGDVSIEVFSRDSIVASGSRVEVVEVSDNKVYVKVLI